jgi:hypothetical protein
MSSTCTVRRVSGSSTDPATGVVTPTYTSVYTGPCKVQSTPGNAWAGSPEAGGHSFTVQSLELHLPVSAGPVRVGDVVDVTADPNDAQLVGRRYRVVAEHHKSWATAQRVPVEEVQG